MKHHLVLGVSILLGLLTLGLWFASYLDRAAEKTAGELHRAAQFAVAGELEEAEACARSAKSHWEAKGKVLACFEAHNELEEIDVLFRELEAWYATGKAPEYAWVCYRLEQTLLALVQGEKGFYFNFL